MLRGFSLAALAVTLIAAAGCGGDGKSGASGGDVPGGTAGKQVFVENCGSCHTLASASTTGEVGTNLDLRLSAAAAIEEQVRNGGSGMPAFKGQLSDQEIADVTAFVAESADRGAVSERLLFFVNCGSCHTLASASTYSPEGPNLDELQPTAAQVAEKVRRGGGGMPSFAGQLSDEVIAKLAAYVAQNASPTPVG